jgi:hypothetical protein
MAIRKFSTASISAGSNKSTKLWDQETFQSGMLALATITLTNSTTASITFSNIPANYTHLQIRGVARSASTGGSMRMDLNSDATGSNYSRHLLLGDGTSASGSGANADSVTAAVGDFPTSSAASSIFGGYIINITDAFNTSKNKTIRSFSGFDTNNGAGYGYVQLRSALWRSQSAITSIKLYEGTNGSNFAAYTTFSLYGIESA